MGWLIALGILILLLILPLGVSACYDDRGPRVWVLAGPVKVPVYPTKQKKESTVQEKPKSAKKTEKPAQKSGGAAAKAAPAPEKKGGPITDFLPLVPLVLDFLSDFRKKLRINRLEMNLVLAGGDPCDLAMNYGKAWAALGNLWPRLEEFLVIRKRDVQVQCDFEGDKTRITARLDMTLTLARVFSVGIPYGFRAIKELIKITNKRKGGAAT